MNNLTNMGCMIFLLPFARFTPRRAVGRVRRDPLAARKDFAHVVEHDHSVAQQAPPLLGVTGDRGGGIAVAVVSRGARGLV